MSSPTPAELKRAGLVAPERDVQRAICDYLALSRIFFIRVNSGFMLMGSGPRRRAVKLAPAGTSDIIAFVPCGGTQRPLAIEVKTRYGTLSPDQARWLAERRLEGWTAIVARSVDDVHAAVEAVQRGERP